MPSLTQETVRRYIADLEAKASRIGTQIATVQARIDVRRIEQLVIDQDVLTDAQIDVLAKAKIAYVGTVGDSMDDHEVLRDLQAQLEATSVLLIATERMAA